MGHFLRAVGQAGGLHRGDLLALDLETNDHLPAPRVARFARRWCDAVIAQAGVRPVVYTFLSFARNGNCAGLESYPLWIAAPDHPRAGRRCRCRGATGRSTSTPTNRWIATSSAAPGPTSPHWVTALAGARMPEISRCEHR